MNILIFLEVMWFRSLSKITRNRIQFDIIIIKYKKSDLFYQVY